MARQNNYPIFENNSTVITAEFMNGLVNNVKTLNQEDGVFDISIANAVSGVPITYNSLELALSGTNIPVDVRKGGMAVKFINSGSGKYEQWVLKASSWSTTESDWVSVTDVKAEDVSYGESNVKEELDKLSLIKIDNSNYQTSVDNIKDAIVELYVPNDLSENERLVISYLSKTGNNYYIYISRYNTSTQTATVVVNNKKIIDKQITELKDSEDNTVAYILFDSDGYKGAVSNTGQGYAKMPYLNSRAYNLSDNPQIMLATSSLKTDIMSEVAADYVPKVEYFDIVAARIADLAKVACITEIYTDYTLGENERIVCSYLSIAGSKYYVIFSKWNTSTSTSESFVAQTEIKDGINVFSAGDNKVYAVFDSSKYTSTLNNAGQGIGKMPYLTANGYDVSKSTEINIYLSNARLKTDILTEVDANYEKSIHHLAVTLAIDIPTRDKAINAIEQAYIDFSLGETERIVLVYLAKTGNYYYVYLYKFDSSDSSSVALVSNQKIADGMNKYSTDAGNIYIVFDHAKLTGTVSSNGQGMARLPYLTNYTLADNDEVYQYLQDEEIGGIKDKIEVPYITVWGDSITWGSAATTPNKCYAMILQSLITSNGKRGKVINCGIGGENFQNILVRQGAFGFYLVDDITIPSDSTEKVEVQRMTNYVHNRKFKNTWYGNDSYFGLLLQGEVGRGSTDYPTVNPIIVRGVECTLSIEGTQSDSITYLKANSDLAENLIVKAGTFLYPAGNRIRTDIVVLSIGTNDGWTINTNNTLDLDKSIENYIAMTDLAISKANTDKFVVCSPYGGTALVRVGVNGLISLENALAKKYGGRFFAWRKYLNEYGLADAGITPTAQDETDIADGKCPSSLLSDGLHPNDAGHEILGKKLYEIMCSLGYV